MREDIDNIISDKFNNLEFNLNDMDTSNNIDQLINNTNNKAEEEKYKESLIKQIEEIQKLGVDIKYLPTMSIAELENIISSVKF